MEIGERRKAVRSRPTRDTQEVGFASLIPPQHPPHIHDARNAPEPYFLQVRRRWVLDREVDHVALVAIGASPVPLVRNIITLDVAECYLQFLNQVVPLGLAIAAAQLRVIAVPGSISKRVAVFSLWPIGLGHRERNRNKCLWRSSGRRNPWRGCGKRGAVGEPLVRSRRIGFC